MSLLEAIKRDLKIPPHACARIRELELYAEQVGDEALARQVELGKTRYRCCWNDVGDPHHPLCPVGKTKA